MMKFTGALSTGLAALFAVPVVLGQDHREITIESALGDTIAALEVLAGLEQDLKSGDRAAVERVLEWTEAPPTTPEALDELLVKRRDEVGVLRMQVEGWSSNPAGTPGSAGDPAAALPSLFAGSRSKHGLDPAVLRTLGTITPTRVETTPAEHGQPERPFTEPSDYSADALGQAQAYYRATRYAEGLRLLDQPGTDAEKWYWRGRLLERLERNEEAAKAYERVIELEPESHSAERANSNLDFLRWKVDFMTKVPSPPAASAKGSRP